MVHPVHGLIILVSSHEATRSITTDLPGPDTSPSHGYPYFPPPPWHFIRLPWLISDINLYSWVERGTVREKCFAQEQNTLTWPGYKCRPLDTESNTGQVTNADLLTLSPAQARLQMQTPKPWVHLTNHKATLSPQEGRVYAESFLISNKFYKTKVKFSYLIFKGDYRSKLIKYVFNSISSSETNAHICIDGC